MTEITSILDAAARGDGRAVERLLPLVYDELRRLARARARRLTPGQTLTPTELVHEVYLRIWDTETASFEGRQHFFFSASRAMRDILVENARHKSRLKRGGDQLRVDLEDFGVAAPREDVLDLDRALDKLAKTQPDGAQIVQLRYFVGLTIPEIAEVTESSEATVKRRWTYARAWLQRELSPPPETARGRNVHELGKRPG